MVTLYTTPLSANGRRFPFDAFPGIAAWYTRIEATEAWRASAAGPWQIAG